MVATRQKHLKKLLYGSSECMSSPGLDVVIVRLSLSSHEALKHEDAIASYHGVDNHLFKLYGTVTVVDKTCRENRTLEQGSLIP